MRALTPGEILSLSSLLQMESNALAVAKASLMAINDEQLKTLTQAGITATQSRIMGLQQFIAENQVAPIKEVQ
ncbi:MAG TPA: hypothetical protein PLC07_12105 [Bacillota bacterium]|nr:hypothetical protein [Bacillota bacterium]HPT88213.1 hypothetical protein [Bacillota bacterium]